MSIEFHCSQCGQLLRVPDTAAGKQARCPKCQSLMPVPAGEADIRGAMVNSAPGVFPPQPANGATSPPSTGNPFAGEEASNLPPPAGFSDAPGSMNPYASPVATANSYVPPMFYAGGRPGLPWENEPRSIGCWFRTMGTVLSSPTRAFSMMRQYGGLGTPLLYNVYAVSMLLALLLVIAVPVGIVIALMNGVNNQRDFFLGAAAVGVAGLIMVGFYVVMITVVTPFVWSAVAHLMLLLYGGARQGFETTFRVVCFGYFSVLVPGMFLFCVPYLGALAVWIWAIVIVIFGLSRAHEISGGKATAAVLTPIGLCCGLYAAFAAVFFAGPGFMEALKGN